MRWFSRKAAPQPEQKSIAGTGILFGSRLLTPPAASYTRLASEGYGQNAVAFACANKISTAVASTELHLFRDRGNGKTERIEQSDLLTLLNRPNPLQSGREFMGHLANYFTLSGNSYVYGSGMKARGSGKTPPKELQLLSPGHMKVDPGNRIGLPKAYEYSPNGSTKYTYEVDQLSARSEILHLKTFNPLSPWFGMAPMEAAALAIDMHNAGNVWNYSLLKQGARPSGALMLKGKDGQPATLTDEQFARVKQEVDEQYSGSSNAGRPLLLEGGLEWQEMSMSPKDVDFLNGKDSAARDIALAFGVPPQLLGIPGDATYNNMAEARLALYTDTVLPLLQLILGGFNRWLTPQYGDDLYLWYDEEMIPALEPLRKAKSDRINNDATKTIDEKRLAMGDDSLPDGIGNVVLVPSSMIPLELAGTVDLAEPGSEDDPDEKADDEKPEEDDDAPP